jgi:NADPH:quinone reductase-like Zn-dependent oxidoreductase
MATPQQTNFGAVLPSPTAPLVLTSRSIPTPGPNDLLIRSRAVALNPADWKMQAYNIMISSYPTILGSDVAGTVSAVGSSVTTFKEGDRVLAFAPSIRTSNPDQGGLQTYCIVDAISAAKIPDSVDFKDAATIPMALATAGIAIFSKMEIPRPPLPPAKPTHPESSIFLVWSASSSIGSVAVQIAASLGFAVFATASKTHHSYLKSLGATATFDYRDPGVESTIVHAASAHVKSHGLSGSITHACDAISEGGTSETISSILSSCNANSKTPAKLVTSLPWPADAKVPANVTVTMTAAMSIGTTNIGVGTWLFNEWAPAALESRVFKPSPPVQIVEGGLEKAQEALDLLRKGVSGKKLVLEVE